MLMRGFIAVVVIVAVAAGLATVFLRDQIVHIAMFHDFFDVAVPILGFGALIKYLCSCPNCCNHKDD